uniref:Leucine rich repeat containing 74A n=1 Tax=Pseudonaja textilis TaxID=8673 RepID=A0A670YC31_PSETE
VGVIPVSYFTRNMEEPVMNLNHHGLGPKGTKAIAIALVSNTTITHLELEDNWILAEGTTYLVQMLRENCYIQEMVFCVSVSAPIFLQANYRVIELDLSYNEFAEKGGELFGQVLANNESLEILDLSWNHLRLKGAIALSNSLKVRICRTMFKAVMGFKRFYYQFCGHGLVSVMRLGRHGLVGVAGEGNCKISILSPPH